MIYFSKDLTNAMLLATEIAIKLFKQNLFKSYSNRIYFKLK